MLHLIAENLGLGFLLAGAAYAVGLIIVEQARRVLTGGRR